MVPNHARYQLRYTRICDTWQTRALQHLPDLAIIENFSPNVNLYFYKRHELQRQSEKAPERRIFIPYKKAAAMFRNKKRTHKHTDGQENVKNRRWI